MKKIIVLMLLLLIAGCSKKPVTLKSGVKYEDDTVGTGTEAKLGDLVSFQFTGWVIMKDSAEVFKDWNKDSTKMGYIFASTKLKNVPIKVLLDGQSFIKGSDEGIVGMKVGGTRTIVLPPSAPNTHGQMDMMPPHPGLKLQVKLLSAKQPTIAKPWTADTTKLSVTKDGLRYVIIQQGTGPNVADGNFVTVNYSGYLLNGDKFDSSVERETPFTFRVGYKAVLDGWDEGVKLLNKGAKAKFFIPASLAFGPRQVGKIPPNSTVVFDIEILDVK
ncbi:MAG: FKBP-type peptidyl-prolyl cis-trans isomerase [Ignavibacteriaceae bacterium]|nr:FKBP-type peptidyl-prolyl cis-trans isomerase [Ignavibacteriaceae bacterium]